MGRVPNLRRRLRPRPDHREGSRHQLRRRRAYPPETGLLLDALKQVRSASYYQIPASTETRGHGTTSAAKFYQQPLRDFLATLPKNGS